jgi:hypothetical protein
MCQIVAVLIFRLYWSNACWPNARVVTVPTIHSIGQTTHCIGQMSAGQIPVSAINFCWPNACQPKALHAHDWSFLCQPYLALNKCLSAKGQDHLCVDHKFRRPNVCLPNVIHSCVKHTLNLPNVYQANARIIAVLTIQCLGQLSLSPMPGL